MNRFKKLIDELRERVARDDSGAVVTDDDIGEDRENGENVPRFRLPYSSDPEPIEKAWNSQYCLSRTHWVISG